MENNKINKWMSVSVFVLIIVCASLLAFFAIRLISFENSSPTDEKGLLKIEKDVYDKVTKPIEYGQAVSVDEQGFGRPNPFAPYK